MKWSEGTGSTGGHSQAANPVSAPKRAIKVTIPRWNKRWVVAMDEFKEGVVGAKSNNLAGAAGAPPGGAFWG